MSDNFDARDQLSQSYKNFGLQRKILTEQRISNGTKGDSRAATSRKRSKRREARFMVPNLKAKFIDENRFIFQ